MTENKIHKLKIDDIYLQALLSGVKRFEIRLNDRDYQVGDFLEFEKNNNRYVFAVRYVHSGLGLQDNYVCMTVEFLPYSSDINKD